VSGLLVGKTVNLKIMERDDVDFLVECLNDIDFGGEYVPIGEQISKAEGMKYFDSPPNLASLTEAKTFIVQKKDGTKIGFIYHQLNQPYKWMEIGYFFAPSERGKGYGSEAVQLMVDYLFKELARIHAIADVRNSASQRVLEKAGFQREGTMRKCLFNRGEWRDYYLYSILKEEWRNQKH